MNTQPQTCLIRGGLIEVTKALSATSEQKHSSDFGRGKALFGDLAPCSPEAIDVTSLTCNVFQENLQRWVFIVRGNERWYLCRVRGSFGELIAPRENY